MTARPLRKTWSGHAVANWDKPITAFLKDFGSGHIIIRDSKNGQPRHVPMDSTVRDLLSGYTPSVSISHVFPSASGGRLSTVQKAFRNARIRAGMPELHFHDLRHTFASQWVMNGGDPYVLKDILGHKSVAMTQRYAHLSPAFKQAMVERMEQMWRKSALAASPARRPQLPPNDPKGTLTSQLQGIAAD